MNIKKVIGRQSELNKPHEAKIIYISDAFFSILWNN
jgi:hypothetical protein